MKKVPASRLGKSLKWVAGVFGMSFLFEDTMNSSWTSVWGQSGGGGGGGGGGGSGGGGFGGGGGGGSGFSDARLKNRFEPLTDALSTVHQLRGVRFHWNQNGQPDLGLIAQEVERVLPELVRQESGEEFKRVNYAHLTAVLIEAVKELSAKVELLEARQSQQNSKS